VLPESASGKRQAASGNGFDIKVADFDVMVYRSFSSAIVPQAARSRRFRASTSACSRATGKRALTPFSKGRSG
jgi:phosphomevalonate kinase